MELVAEKYKQTEVGLIPSDWIVKKLGDFSVIKSGESPSKFIMYNVGTPYFKVEQLNNGNKYTAETPYYIQINDPVKKGSIVFPKRGASILLNKIRIFSSDSYLDTNLMALSLENTVYSEFIFYVLSHFGLDKIADTTSIPQINNKHIYPFAIGLPPTKAEQTAIASALSDADALISSLEKLIDKKSNIKQGAMQKLLQPKEGWEMKKLGDVCENLGSGKSKTQSQDGVFPIFGSTGVIGWSITFDYSGHKILVARVGANAGKVNVVDGKYCVTDNTLMLSLKPEIDLNFIYSFLILFQLNKLVFGSGQPLITGGQLKNIELKIPKTKEEQTHIATILCDMNAEINLLETKLEKYRKVKLGMMQNLLTGKIRLI